MGPYPPPLSVAILCDRTPNCHDSFYLSLEARSGDDPSTTTYSNSTSNGYPNVGPPAAFKAEPSGPASMTRATQLATTAGATSKNSSIPSQILHTMEKGDSGLHLKKIFETLYNHYVTIQSGPWSLKLSGITLDQFHATKTALSSWAKAIRRPHLSYLLKFDKLISKWLCELHESMICTLDSMFAQEVVTLAPANLVDVTVHHNTELKTTDGGVVIPDVCLRFYSKAPIPNVTYPAICQIAFSVSLDDALDVIERIVEGNPSVLMALLLDVKESPPYSRPSANSEAWTMFSKDQAPKTLPNFSVISSRAGATDNVFTDPVITGNHIWCSITNVNFSIWLRNPSTSVLDVQAAATGEYSACYDWPG